ncbi:LOW QUALITY PROTEIN: uncharacterized protein RCH25_025915 [Pelodytes ibericus]
MGKGRHVDDNTRASENDTSRDSVTEAGPEIPFQCRRRTQGEDQKIRTEGKPDRRRDQSGEPAEDNRGFLPKQRVMTRSSDQGKTQEWPAAGAERSPGQRRASRRRNRGWGGRKQHFAHHEQYEGPSHGERLNVFMDEDRQRGHRFTEANAALVNGVLRRYENLLGHSSARGSSLRKRCYWQEIVNEVNSKGCAFRTIEVCKKRYGDCRRVVKAKMAALEQQALGKGEPEEEIHFNTWEDNLRRKISTVALQAAEGAGDTSETSTFQPKAPRSTRAAEKATSCPSSTWSSIIDTAVPELQAVTASDSEEATSPLDHQLLGDWSEDDIVSPFQSIHQEKQEALCDPPATPTLPSQPAPPTLKNPADRDPWIQEEYNEQHRQLNRARNVELHKLRGNVVQGNSSIARHLEGLTREVRELNAHVRHIHMNQTHFNLMFQNYLSDTKQFYGAVVHTLQNLHQAPTVSPMASPAYSPAPSPKPPPMTPPPPPSPPTTSPSQSVCAEAASASSTASETTVCRRRRGLRTSSISQRPTKY